MKKLLFSLSIGGLIIMGSCTNKTKKSEIELNSFIKKHVKQVSRLYTETCETYYKACITGDTNLYKKYSELSIKITKIYSNKDDFAKLKAIKNLNAIKDSLLARQLDVLYRFYAKNQTDPKKLEEIVKISTVLEAKYAGYRANLNGKNISDNDVEKILFTSNSSKEVQAAWEAHKKIGNFVYVEIIKLVNLRNEIAQELGYKNYHEMSLKLDEQDPEEISKLFDELDNHVRTDFTSLKDEIDIYLSTKFKIKKQELRPWHYQGRYFQEAPKIYTTNLDKYYEKQNSVELCRKYFEGIGIEAGDIIDSSDLYEKPGKYQHAFCMDMNKQGKTLILCNMKNNKQWTGTLLHELGHADYCKYMDFEKTPYLLRDAAHSFTTEAVAMFFGRLSSNPQWMQDVALISESEKIKISSDCKKIIRLEQLIFSRWVQVVYRFEKEMYNNPNQDLNKLWWDLVENYQMVKRPENRNQPDWATKIHIALYPCYYHNYMLGELLASQFNHYLIKNILNDDNKNGFINNKDIGKFFIDKVFKTANIYNWNVMIEKATGEKLNPQYYAEQFTTNK